MVHRPSRARWIRVSRLYHVSLLPRFRDTAMSRVSVMSYVSVMSVSTIIQKTDICVTSVSVTKYEHGHNTDISSLSAQLWFYRRKPN